MAGTPVALPLAGRFNVANALVAAAVAVTLGVTEDQVVAGRPAAGPVPPGRLEVARRGHADHGDRRLRPYPGGPGGGVDVSPGTGRSRGA